MDFPDILNFFGKKSRGVDTPNSSADLKPVENMLKNISKAGQLSVDGSSYFPRAYSFPEWITIAAEVNDPNAARTAIYYGFQPLYDLLIAGKLLPEQRETAVQSLNKVVNIGIIYLTGFYSGEQDIKSLRDKLSLLKQPLSELAGAEYKLKPRNIDWNDIFPQDIHSFTLRYLEKILDGQATKPDYIVGCACGSSEIAMPLAGLLEVDLGFIRRSKRRGDNSPMVIEEHDSLLRKSSKGYNVLCVEDYVCSGRSLQKVMNKVAGYGAQRVEGVSLRNSREADKLKLKLKERGLSLFSL